MTLVRAAELAQMCLKEVPWPWGDTIPSVERLVGGFTELLSLPRKYRVDCKKDGMTGGCLMTDGSKPGKVYLYVCIGEFDSLNRKGD